MTHFASADEARGVAWQMQVLERAAGRPRPAAQPRQFGGDPAPSRNARRLGASRHHALRLLAVFRRAPAPTSDLKPVMTLESRVIAVQQLEARRHGGLRRAVHGRARYARRRRRVRLCRRLSAPRADRHAGHGRRPHDPAPSAGCPWTCCAPTCRTSRRRGWARASCCGARTCRSSASPRRRAPSATSCCARLRRAFGSWKNDEAVLKTRAGGVYHCCRSGTGAVAGYMRNKSTSARVCRRDRRGRHRVRLALRSLRHAR